jgi:hypothetical protein
MLDPHTRSNLEIRVVDVPPPEPKLIGSARDALFAALSRMKVGGEALELNRGLKSVQNYIYRFRVRHGRELRYIARGTGPGCSRVWRVQ